MGLGVTGGAGGIRAVLEDLAAVSHVLALTAETVSQATSTAGFARLQIGGCGGLDFGPGNARLHDLLTTLAAPASDAQRAGRQLQHLADVLRWVAQVYSDTDHGVASGFGSFVAGLPSAMLKSGERLWSTGDPLSAVEQFITADPESVDLFVDTSVLSLVAAAKSSRLPDGHAEVVDDAVDVSPTGVTAPRSVGDLMSALSVRNDGVSGEVSVSFLTDGTGERHVIVDIPGTKSWTLGRTSDVTSLTTDVRALYGNKTSYEDGVLQAMSDAGVTSHDDVMLVGHSEGGMVAVNTARDADAAGAFHVSHVVTAGSPVARIVGDLPPSVAVLALEQKGDIVPRADGAANPDLPNVTTVTGGSDTGSIGNNHHLDTSYLPLAGAVDRSTNPSIRAFTDGASGFLDQDQMTTERYVISRAY